MTAAGTNVGTASKGSKAVDHAAKCCAPNATIGLTQPRARVLCFHGAGADGLIFTTRGTRTRPLPNPLLDYCIENEVELLAVTLPGRGQRHTEKRERNALSAAESAMELLHRRLDNSAQLMVNGRPTTPATAVENEVPLVVVGHSMGAYVAYEFVCLMRNLGMTLPRFLIFACMVPPDVPPESRPWKRTSNMSAEELKEECRAWGCNEELFQSDVWNTYEPILRDDFAIIDDYTFAEPVKTSSRFSKSNRSDREARSGSSHARNGGERTGGAAVPVGGRNSPSTSSTASGTSLQLDFSKSLSFHAPLGISTMVFHGMKDSRISAADCANWKYTILGKNLFSSSPSGFGTLTNEEAEFEVHPVPGGHNFLYEPESRQKFMVAVTEIVDRLLIDQEYGLF